jgi:DNA adenine methylase
MVKPLVSYYGGKQKIVAKILPLFPPHTVYVEPFCGGATMLFQKQKPVLTNKSDYREIINDNNELLITMYRVAIEKPEDLKTKIVATLYSRSDYEKAVDICKNSKNYTDLEIAWAVYVNINQSFANKLNGGFGCGVVSRNLAETWITRQERLQEQLIRLQGVHLECDDAINIIKRYDAPQSLFYCDPPYVGTSQGYYKGYTQEDFDNLCQILDNIQGSFLLSTYKNSSIPEHWEEFDFKTLNSSSKPNNKNKSLAKGRDNNYRTEYVYRKISSVPIREDLKKILEKHNNFLPKEVEYYPTSQTFPLAF